MAKYNFDTKGIATEDLDRIERLCLMDDDFMSKCFEEDFFCTEPDEMRYKVLAERARLFKKTEKGVREMSGVLEEMREEVQKKTSERNALELVKYLLGNNEEVSKGLLVPLIR